MMKLYGITTCDSVRKARKILDQRGMQYQYIDLRQNPPDETLLRDWLARFGTALDFFPNQKIRIIIHNNHIDLSENEIRRTQSAAT